MVRHLPGVTYAFLLLLTFGPSVVFAKTLRDYRETYCTSPEQHSDLILKSDQRVQMTRKHLHTEQYRIPRDTIAKVPLFSAERHERASIFVKSIAFKIATGLRDSDEYDKPITFDPSRFGQEIDAKVAERTHKFCSKVIQPFGSQLARNIWELKRRTQKAKDTSAPLAALNASKQGIGPLITEYIRNNDPGKTLLNQLGQLYQVEVTDGLVSRLRFSKDKKTLANQNTSQYDVNTIPLSLELLATFIAGNNPYYIDSLFCLWTHLEDQKLKHLREEKKKHTSAGQSTIDGVAAQFMQTQFKGALWADARLRMLSREQLHFLFDLLLQLRNGDIPHDLELSRLKLLSKTHPEIAGAMMSSRPNSPSELDLDTDYYVSLDRELSTLTDALQRDKSYKKHQKKILQDIESGALR